jgi:C1A family cysteine protease
MAADSLDVAQLQVALEQSNARWRAGVTELSELSSDERARRLGYVPGPGEDSLEEQERLAAAQPHAQAAAVAAEDAAGAPAAFDLRNVAGKNFVTPITNQGGCGSCVAFGTVATVESTLRVSRANPTLAIDLSEAQLFYCYGGAAGRKCLTGWWVPAAMDSFKKGVADEACFPYTAGNQACKLCAGWEGRAVKIVNWHEISSTADMKAWISTRGPLSACFTVYTDFFNYHSGVYRHVTGKVEGGHCISVVGYNDPGQYWICKNSWGPGWGESGFFCIAYGQCGIDSSMFAVDSTGSWITGAKVTALWSTDQDRNAWAFIEGAGWRKVAPDNVNIFIDMLTQLATAKNTGRPVNVYDNAGVIQQIYAL